MRVCRALRPVRHDLGIQEAVRSGPIVSGLITGPASHTDGEHTRKTPPKSVPPASSAAKEWQNHKKVGVV